jgi:hypothetical protein
MRHLRARRQHRVPRSHRPNQRLAVKADGTHEVARSLVTLICRAFCVGHNRSPGGQVAVSEQDGRERQGLDACHRNRDFDAARHTVAPDNSQGSEDKMNFEELWSEYDPDDTEPCQDKSVAQKFFNAAIEEAAKACEAYESATWAKFKGRTPEGASRGNPYTEGLSDGATECVALVRALRAST